MATQYTCDCCLKDVKGLATLRDEIAPPHIHEICEDCLKALEKAEKPMREQHAKEIKEHTMNFLVDRRAELA